MKQLKLTRCSYERSFYTECSTAFITARSSNKMKQLSVKRLVPWQSPEGSDGLLRSN